MTKKANHIKIGFKRFGVVQMTIYGQALSDSRAAIQEKIRPGDIGGNGCDASAERNGLVSACNIINDMLYAEVYGNVST